MHLEEKISIVMPVLNESGVLHRTLSALRLTEAEELVVVDGGSSDRTVEIAGQFTPHVHRCPRGRARQMNHGAESSTGKILLFLHADCTLPPGAFGMVRRVLSNDGVSAGAFGLGIDHGGAGFRLIELGANLRSSVTRVPYGDQGLFMKRSIFERIGGFRDIPLMEDIEIAGRLKAEGRVVFAGARVMTSPRRWLGEGLVRTTLRDWYIALSYGMLGARPERLARLYRDVR